MTALQRELLEVLRSPEVGAILDAAVKRAADAAAERAKADDLLSVDEGARLTRKSPASLYKQISRGALESVRVGGRVMVRRGDLVRQRGAR